MSFPKPVDSTYPVVMYVTQFCPYCVMAKRLLTQRGIDFEVYAVDGNADARNWLVQETQQRTVPQIFIRGQSIGGFQELAAMDRSGALLEALVASA
jgi:glutaredoxin 3